MSEENKSSGVLSEIWGFLKYWVKESLIPILELLGILLVFGFISTNIHWFFYNQSHWLTSENHSTSFIATTVVWGLIVGLLLYFNSVWVDYKDWKKMGGK